MRPSSFEGFDKSHLLAFAASSLLILASCGDPGEGGISTSENSQKETVQTISWKGHTWNISSGGMAGVAPADPENVFVDANGYLHLKIAKTDNGWTAAELFSTDSMGFGTYQWQIEGRVDQLDKNVVLGLFPYGPQGGIGADGTNEIDIEYARWGNANYPIGNFTVYPNSGTVVDSYAFDFSLDSAFTTSTFVWASDSISFLSQEGLKSIGDNSNIIGSWKYSPSNPSTNIPQRKIALGMNLWCFEATPSDGKEVEVIIRDFKFVEKGAAQYTINASAGTGGAISPAGKVSASPGESRTFAIVPDSGSTIASVLVDGVEKGPLSSYTFANIQASHTISASFSNSSSNERNIAPSGTGYTWKKNSSSTSNRNRAARKAVNDGDLNNSVICNTSGEGGAAKWQGAGVVWSTGVNIAAVEFVNGPLDSNGNGFFEANCKLQFSTDGTTCVNSGWAMNPSYPNDASAVSKKYRFSGAARDGVKGVRIVGQTGPDSWSWSVNEVLVFAGVQ